ncbi:hypothetical protein ABZ712_19365 [Streptomyces sp. NPDC006906]|uniref:hypothetical protein n=1 Tax=Streptomyces sp. NPDC006906 TaxID=3154782 RepID=UPI00340D300B
MQTGLRITAFAAGLAAAFGSAYALGGALDPVAAPKAPSHQDGREAHGGKGLPAAGEGVGEAAEIPGGLQVSQEGFTLDLDTPRIEAGEPAQLRFAVVNEGTSRNVTAFRREHGKELHLVVASNDLATYRHLHPERAADGTWSAPVELPEAGGYRVFADFTPDGKSAEGVVLGADLAVSGDARPESLPNAERTVRVDGYEITLDGALRPGADSELKLEVEKDGRPVTDLQPHLGAYGHLVALRAGDLAYLHVHPNGEPGDGRTESGPEVSFTATAPSKGAYRLFLDFRHEGKVRTAAFSVHAGSEAGGLPAPGGGDSDGYDH